MVVRLDRLAHLPLHAVAASDIRPAVTAGDPPTLSQAQGAAVLLIDDEPGMQRALMRVLQRDGHEITTAVNGLEGLAALAKRSYEVILCDIRMPGLDGPGFYRELQRCHPHLVSRLIFVTGDVMSTEVQTFLTQVDRPYLFKPFKAQAVRRVIQQVLQA